MFPTNNIIVEEAVYKSEYVVYLVDSDNYLSKVTYFYDELSLEEEVRDKLERLINGIDMYDIFFPVIPKNTKINSVKLSKDNIYIDFSSDILDVKKNMEEIMIESIVYTLSEINGINNIYLSVNQEELILSSLDNLSYPLTRGIGINREYNIDNFDNINKTTIVFSKCYDDIRYIVPITLISNENDDKVNIIIEELKSSIYSQNNLNGFINDKLELVDYEIKNDIMNLVFNEFIYSDVEEKVISDDVKLVISQSIFENYDVNQVVINTKKEKNIIKIEEST
jgi:germination protein M